mmetsp:Transcript_31430/g.64282  ORF Transcript_31430/g.64282 Transcript_31430/m.64282 type:complete len:377 (+) Transcript_31430:443-1573(+)
MGVRAARRSRLRGFDVFDLPPPPAGTALPLLRPPRVPHPHRGPRLQDRLLPQRPQPQGQGAGPQVAPTPAIRSHKRRRHRSVLRVHTAPLRHGPQQDPSPLAQRHRRRAHQHGRRSDRSVQFRPLASPFHPVLDRRQSRGAVLEEGRKRAAEGTAVRHGLLLRPRRPRLAYNRHDLLARLFRVPAARGRVLPGRHRLHMARLLRGVRPVQSVRQFHHHSSGTRQHLERGLSRGAPSRAQRPLDRDARVLPGERDEVRGEPSDGVRGLRAGCILRLDVRGQVGRHGRSLRGSQLRLQRRRQELRRGQAHDREANIPAREGTVRRFRRRRGGGGTKVGAVPRTIEGHAPETSPVPLHGGQGGGVEEVQRQVERRRPRL